MAECAGCANVLEARENFGAGSYCIECCMESVTGTSVADMPDFELTYEEETRALKRFTDSEHKRMSEAARAHLSRRKRQPSSHLVPAPDPLSWRGK